MNSKWRIVYEAKARKQLKALDSKAALRITRTLERELERQTTPYGYFERLYGDLEGYRRARVGDYRIIARIEDETVTILVIAVGHRREIYR